jgi:hypothetical protein
MQGVAEVEINGRTIPAPVRTDSPDLLDVMVHLDAGRHLSVSALNPNPPDDLRGTFVPRHVRRE